jgi:hypothetical protein
MWCTIGAMRYRQGKIKREHHSLPEAEPLLAALAADPAVTAVIPGPIVRKKSSGGPRIAVGPGGGGSLRFAVHSPLYVQSVHAVLLPGARSRVLADLRAAGLLPGDAEPAPRPVARPRPEPARPPAPGGPEPMPVLPRIAVVSVEDAAPGVGPDVLARVQAALPALGYARGRFVYVPLGDLMAAIKGPRVAAAFPYRAPWVSAPAQEDLAEEGLGPADAEAMILAAGLWGRTGDFVTQGWELLLDRGDLVGARLIRGD